MSFKDSSGVPLNVRSRDVYIRPQLKDSIPRKRAKNLGISVSAIWKASLFMHAFVTSSIALPIQSG